MAFLLGVMWVISITAGVPIGNIAHLGGLILGVAYGFYLKNKYPHKTKMIARYFS
jgi:membrane associated rhomboid family serine protease